MELKAGAKNTRPKGVAGDGARKVSRSGGRKRSGPSKGSGAGKRREVSGLPVRVAAVSILKKILFQGEPLDRAFGSSVEVDDIHQMEHRDRAFVRLIVTSVLRRRGQIKDVIGQYLEKPLPKRSGSVSLIMEVASAQILFLQTPAHAAINIAVEQCRMDRRGGHLAKLANAVLRRVSEFGPDIIKAQNAERLNTPDWLWQGWCGAYGEAKAIDIARAHEVGPGLDISAKSDPEAWAEKLGGAVLPGGSVRVELKGRVEELAGYEEGEWWVQDVAARLPVLLLGDVKGLRVADLCAAPGGKSALLASQGALVTAVDNSTARIGRLNENLGRLGLDVEVVEADILKWKPPQLFDAVLLDAPCSATGTIRRHPDILHVKKPGDAKELALVQRQMLIHASGFLKPGGKIVFCTCSLEESEGPEHLETISEDLPDMVFEPVKASEFGWPDEWVSPAGYLRTLPQYLERDQKNLSGMDGFFAAKFLKNVN